MQTLKITKFDPLPVAEIRPLQHEAQQQGYTFIDRLVTHYENGRNRFDRPGEALFGVYSGEQLIGVGGLNRDPYVQADDVGRVRHLYVLNAWRRQGVGKLLVQHVIKEATPHFRLLTLRTLEKAASDFYCALGFQTEPQIEGATHHLTL